MDQLYFQNSEKEALLSCTSRIMIFVDEHETICGVDFQTRQTLIFFFKKKNVHQVRLDLKLLFCVHSSKWAKKKKLKRKHKNQFGYFIFTVYNSSYCFWLLKTLFLLGLSIQNARDYFTAQWKPLEPKKSQLSYSNNKKPMNL